MNTTDFHMRKSNRQKTRDRRSFKPIPNRESKESRTDRKQRRRFYPLTASEEKVCMPLSYGKTHKEIADDLDIATNTVSKHIQNAMGKLGINKETALSRRITEQQHGLPVSVGKRA